MLRGKKSHFLKNVFMLCVEGSVWKLESGVSHNYFVLLLQTIYVYYCKSSHICTLEKLGN